MKGSLGTESSIRLTRWIVDSHRKWIRDSGLEKRGTTQELKLEMDLLSFMSGGNEVAQLNPLVALNFQFQAIGFGGKNQSVVGCFEVNLEHCSVVEKVGMLEIQCPH